jgi:hypothetical protein
MRDRAGWLSPARSATSLWVRFRLLRMARSWSPSLRSRPACSYSGCSATSALPPDHPHQTLYGRRPGACTSSSRPRRDFAGDSGVFKRCPFSGPSPQISLNAKASDKIRKSVRGDLNTGGREISPDRGNHAIRVTRVRWMYRGVPPSVRYLVRYLACTWLCGRCGHLLPHRWLQRPRVPGNRAARAGRAAFGAELGTHTQGTVAQERVWRRPGTPIAPTT